MRHTSTPAKFNVRTPRLLLRRAEWFVGGALALSFGIPSLAGPEGAQVVNGDVRITRNGSSTVIQASNNSIISYRSFDIARNESVRFVQPNSSSRVLNRIDSANPTRIDGSLTSNGRVYFVNPAGVYFGQGAVVNVAGLYAGAAQITNQAFLRNMNQFTNASGSVVNEGTIIGEFVGLVGKSVINRGSIVAPQGAVVMGAGSDIMIGEGGGNVYVRVRGEAEVAPGTQAAVMNSGAIEAGKVRVGVGDVYGAALFNAGAIRAKSTRLEGQGKGEVKVSGTIDASNANGKGGDVRVLGERVALDGATIDARGATGGGEVLVGGNFQGRGSERNAERLSVSSDSTIHADATQRGDGGKVVLWSNDRTDYAGAITARGGKNGGNGGNVEVSGKETLAFRGHVNAGADNGRGGQLLLDPRNITVQTGGSDPATGQTYASNAASDVTIDPTAITAITDTGTSVTLQANNDITVNSAITTNNPSGDGGDINLRAGRSILINADITTDGGQLNLIANAAADGAIVGNRTVGAGAITVANGVALNTGAQDLVSFVDLTSTGGFTPGDTTIRAVTGRSVLLQDAGANINIFGTLTLTGNYSSLGTNFDNTGGSITTTGGTISLAHTGTVLVAGAMTSGGGDIGIEGDSITVSAHANSGAGRTTLNAVMSGVTVTSGRVSAAELLLLGSGAFVVTNTMNAVDTFAANVSGAVTFTNGAAFNVGTVGITSGITSGGFGVSLASGDRITLDRGINAGMGAVSLVATDGVLQNTGATILGDTLTLTGVGAFDLRETTNDVNSIAAAVSGSVMYADTNDLIVNATGVNVTGATPGVEIAAGGALTLTGNVRAVGGSVDLLAGNGMAQGGSSAITTQSLLVHGTGNAVLNGTSNDAQVLAANVDGGFTYRDVDGLTIGTVGASTGVVAGTVSLNIGGELFAATQVRALNGSLTALSGGRMAIGANAGATTNLALWSGTSGSGDLEFDSGATIASPIITLRAGDGLAGNGTAATVRAMTTASSGPFFTGTSGGSSPTVFTIRQDGAIESLPLAAQFGAGPGGVAYTLQSDDSGINLASSTAPLSLLGADLVLTPAAGSSAILAGEFSLNSLTANGPVVLNGAISGANLTFTDVVTFGSGSPSTLAATTGVISLQAGFNAQNNVTFRAKEIDLGAASTGTGALTFTSSNATAIRIGDSVNNAGDGVLDITQGELDFLAGGSFAALRFGSADFTGGITYMPAMPIVFDRAIEFRTDVGGSTTLLSDVLTNGHAIALQSDVILGAPTIRIDSTNFGAAVDGADITFGGTINSDMTSARALVIQGGATGNVVVNGIAGLVNPLDSMVAAGRSLTLNAVRSNNSQQYFGEMFLSGDLSTSATDAPITIRGNVLLTSDVSIVTGAITSGNGILIDGGVDSATRGAPRSLLLRSNTIGGLGDITVLGDIGSTAPLQDATLHGRDLNVQSLEAGGIVSFTGHSTVTSGLITGGAISFVGPSTINGGIAGGTATFTGATTLNSNVSGSTIAFNSPVTLGTDVIITATNSVAFEDTLDASAGSGLIVRSPQTTFDGDVGLVGALDELLVQSTTPGARVSFTGSGVRYVRTTNGQSYEPDVITSLDAVFRSANSDIAFRGRLDSQPGGSRREVRLELPGTALLGTTGFLNPLQTLVVGTNNGTLPTTRVGGAGVTTIGTQTYDGAMVLASDAVFTGNGIIFGGTIDSDSASTPRRFEVVAGAGAATLQGNAGLNVNLGSVFVSGSSVSLQGVRAQGRQVYTGSPITLNGSLFSLSSGDIRLEGPVRLTRDVTVRTFGTSANDDITFTSTADGVAGVFSLDANAGLGDLSFGGAIGRINGSTTPSIRDLRLRGSSSITLQGVSTTGLQQYTGVATLNSDILTTGSGGILFNNGVTLNSDSISISANAGGVTLAQGVDSSANTNRSLTLTSTGGPVSLLGSIGGVTRLNTLNVNGNFVLLVGPEVRTTSIQSYNAPVQIGGNTRFEGSVITFSSTLDSASSAARTVTINSTASAGGAGQVNFLGAVGAVFSLQSLNVSSGISRVSSNITTRGGIEFANAVNLSGNSIMDAGNGGVFFRSTLDALTDFAGSSLELRSNLAATPTATPFRFGGNVGANAVLGTLTIGANGSAMGLPAPATAATIVFSDAWDSTGAIASANVAPTDAFEIRATNFVMGRNQKLTSFGNFLIRGTGTDATSAANSASIGDITSIGTITVRANTINLLTRPGGTLLDNFGQTDRDTGLDFVAAGAITFSSAPLGGNSTVQFSNNSGNVSSNLNGFVVRQYTNGVAPALFASGANLLRLDLKAEGPSLANTATVLAAALPRNEDLTGYRAPASIDPSLVGPLSELGISTRELDADEQLMFLVGTSLYNDLSPPASMGGGEVSVSSARLDRESVERAVAGYRTLFLSAMLDENGNQVMGADGRPAFDPESREATAARLKETLASAWSAYSGKGGAVTGEGFRAYLESQTATTSERSALDILDRARDLLDDIDAMGLAPFESRGPKGKVLETIRPSGMTPEQIKGAVMGEAVASR